jgi:hypothetical protein
MITLREQVESNIKIKYNIDIKNESIHTAMGILSENDWRILSKCMKFPNYGLKPVCEPSGVII